jgi:hypothetical protein
VAIPGSDGVIHACRKNTDGSLRAIDTEIGQSCASGYTPLNWPQQGPQGPPGPSGLTGLAVVTASRSVAPGERAGVNALVPSGKVLVAGGFSMGEPWGVINASTPSIGGCYPDPGNCWHVEATNTHATESLTLTAYVMYADA